MTVLPGAINPIINNGTFNAVSTTVSNIGVPNDIVALLHSHSATAGLLDAKERFDAPTCDEGTRTSMILGMKKFVQDGDAASSPALYWLHGPAGVGKSALAQSLSLLMKSEGDHAASFFFSRTSHGRNDGNQLVVTLAYQLVTNFPTLRRFMSKAVRKNPAVLTASNAVQMQSLIVDPINKWHKIYNRSIWKWIHQIINKKPYPRLILVDGLDECNDPKVQTDLILCIASAVSQLSIPLRFVITSRPESHILVTFELNLASQGLGGVAITMKNLGDDEDADEQITVFLLKEFADIRRVHPIRDFLPKQWPRPDQIEQLVLKSSKSFIYPATVIRYIKMPHNRPDECLDRILGLSEIPKFDKPYEPLDILYRHIFESVPEANKRSVHIIFHFFVLPHIWKGSTYPPTIEQYLGYPPGHVQHVLRDLLCVVNFTSDGHIRLLHASLPDFLLDKSRSGSLFIDAINVHATAAASYLSAFRQSGVLPHRDHFSNFLHHLQEANMSNTLLIDQIMQTDLLQQYTLAVDACQRSRNVSDRLQIIGIEGTAFISAYLLALVIWHGPQMYIINQIASIKGYISSLYPADAWKIHVTSIMTSIFLKWKTTIYHERINRIFESEVTSSQNGIREAIFELHFLMTVYSLREQVLSFSSLTDDDTAEYPKYDWTNQEPHYWANIVVGRNY